MNFLNKQQLAFLLDIKVEQARAKMCHAWCREQGIDNKAYENEKGKIVDTYPEAMLISMLAEHLNLPTLQESVDDIQNHYLTRAATKKWILCDYPEKKLKAHYDAAKPGKPSLTVPPGLKSLLPSDVLVAIIAEWKSRYPFAKWK